MAGEQVAAGAARAAAAGAEAAGVGEAAAGAAGVVGRKLLPRLIGMAGKSVLPGMAALTALDVLFMLMDLWGKGDEAEAEQKKVLGLQKESESRERAAQLAVMKKAQAKEAAKEAKAIDMAMAMKEVELKSGLLPGKIETARNYNRNMAAAVNSIVEGRASNATGRIYSLAELIAPWLEKPPMPNQESIKRVVSRMTREPGPGTETPELAEPTNG